MFVFFSLLKKTIQLCPLKAIQALTHPPPCGNTFSGKLPSDFTEVFKCVYFSKDIL